VCVPDWRSGGPSRPVVGVPVAALNVMPLPIPGPSLRPATVPAVKQHRVAETAGGRPPLVSPAEARRRGLDGMKARTRTNRIWAARALDALRVDPRFAGVAGAGFRQVVLTELGRLGEPSAIRAAALDVEGVPTAVAVVRLRRIRRAGTRGPVLRRADRDELAVLLRATVERYAAKRVGCGPRVVRAALAAARDDGTAIRRGRGHDDVRVHGGDRVKVPAALLRRLRDAATRVGGSVHGFGDVVLVHADCRSILPELRPGDVACLIGDFPYGRRTPRWPHRTRGSVIAGDDSTELRDFVLKWADTLPVACFGTWRSAPPTGARARLVWDKGPCSGMGDLSLPWKNSAEEIFILGKGWRGERDQGVLRVPQPSPVQSPRRHAMEKPVELIARLLDKAPPGVVIDPSCGSGSTLLAARALGRPAVGIEIDERWVRVAVRRLRVLLTP